MIFRLADQFLLEGTPAVTCSHLLLRAGPANVPLLQASSRCIFKVYETEVTASSLSNFLQSLIALMGNFILLSMLEFPWLQLVAFSLCLLAVHLREGSDSALTKTTLAREQVFVCDVRM